MIERYYMELTHEIKHRTPSYVIQNKNIMNAKHIGEKHICEKIQ